jgi:soluble lytic murein transglycosylase-like protein
MSLQVTVEESGRVYRPSTSPITTTILSVFSFVCFIGQANASDYYLVAANTVMKPVVSAPPENDFTLTQLLTDITREVPASGLSAADAETYRTVFAEQSAGNWSAADQKIGELTDKRLIGHVMQQRFMHPTAYKATFSELQAWLKLYADLPDAKAVFSLAQKRQAKDSRGRLTSPITATVLRGGMPEAAVEASDNPVSWVEGLNAWRQGDYQSAFNHFSTVAKSRVSEAERAAGAFWAARSLTRLGQPREVTKWLARAAANPRTFYGLLANRQLGLPQNLNWQLPAFTPAHVAALAQNPAGARAIALLQAGQPERAEAELRQIHPKGDETLKSALISLCSLAGMPSLSFRLGVSVRDKSGDLYDAALYPLLPWQPKGGFAIDRALLFALVRQESRYETEAQSDVGATGLMQIMPRTANYIAAKSELTTNPDQLAEPELNLALGQRYIEYLLTHPEVKGNLLHMLAAYNSGPGQLSKWMDSGQLPKDDPLLFIESLPSAETRDFVERVLANYWVYQLQLEQETPSLVALAKGQWPGYHSQDVDQLRLAAK